MKPDRDRLNCTVGHRIVTKRTCDAVLLVSIGSPWWSVISNPFIIVKTSLSILIKTCLKSACSCPPGQCKAISDTGDYSCVDCRSGCLAVALENKVCPRPNQSPRSYCQGLWGPTNFCDKNGIFASDYGGYLADGPCTYSDWVYCDCEPGYCKKEPADNQSSYWWSYDGAEICVPCDTTTGTCCLRQVSF